MKRELNLTIFLMALKSLTLTGSGSLTMRKVTPSAQGGVVSEPEYCRMFEEAILACTPRKSRPRAMVALLPGVAFLLRLELRPAMMASLFDEDTSNIRAMTAS